MSFGYRGVIVRFQFQVDWIDMIKTLIQQPIDIENHFENVVK